LRQTHDAGDVRQFQINEKRALDDNISSDCESEYSAEREQRDMKKARKRQLKTNAPKNKKTEKAGSKTKPAMLNPDEVLRLGGKNTSLGGAFSSMSNAEQRQVCVDMSRDMA
jgi:hypothetical protein